MRTLALFLFLHLSVFQMASAQESTTAVVWDHSQTAERNDNGAPAKEISQKLRELLLKGNKLHGARDLEGAAKLYVAATELAPYSYAAWFNLGITCLLAKDFQRAETALAMAQKIRPSSVPVYEYLGVTYSALNKDESAVVAYKSALKNNPDSIVANNNLGHVSLRQGKYGDAEAYFQKVITLKSNSKEAYGDFAWRLRSFAKTWRRLTHVRLQTNLPARAPCSTIWLVLHNTISNSIQQHWLTSRELVN
jgi:tetratricopeptide (TPR) repeat protein